MQKYHQVILRIRKTGSQFGGIGRQGLPIGVQIHVDLHGVARGGQVVTKHPIDGT